MADVKVAYGSASSLISTTLNSAASSSTATFQSSWHTNTAGGNLYLDALLTCTFVVGTGSTAGEKGITIYGLASYDGVSTTTRSGGNAPSVAGSPTTYLMDDPTTTPGVYPVIGFIPVPTASQTYRRTFSVAQAFGGWLPSQWGILVRNYTGFALAASGSDCSYTPIYQTVT